MIRSLTALLFAIICFGVLPAALARDFYQLTIYEYSTKEQEKQLDAYLENTYLPALHRNGIADVGVFKPVAPGTENDKNKIYVFVPFKTRQEFFNLEAQLNKDEAYLSSGTVYLNAAFNNPPYDRKEVILLDAFEKHPHYELPKLNSPKESRIYELRSYESPTEKLYRNKVKMFNEGDEVGLFKKLGFNAVFYGDVISGSHMPNLMYLTTFENKAARDDHWEAFGNDPYWKTLSAKPEYQNNVSKADILFLYPVSYSDI